MRLVKGNWTGLPSKFHNVQTENNGIVFHSKKEAIRHSQLLLLVAAGEIEHLILQAKFPFIINGEECGSYVADFVYRDLRSGWWVVEDVKGKLTDMYKLKRKLVYGLYGIKIFET